MIKGRKGYKGTDDQLNDFAISQSLDVCNL